jgi:hypothetical protein
MKKKITYTWEESDIKEGLHIRWQDKNYTVFRSLMEPDRFTLCSWDNYTSQLLRSKSELVRVLNDFNATPCYGRPTFK